MSGGVPKVEEATRGLDEEKRKTLTRLVTGTAFVAPVVASFAMDSMTIAKAVTVGNGTGSNIVVVKPAA
jgi:hypothetical protein